MNCLKQEFKSKREALEVLKAIRERGKTSSKKSKKPNRIYECKSCGHYHITSRRVVRQ